MARDEVVRWGRSAYETDETLAAEQAAALARGLGWRLHVEAQAAPAGLGRCAVLVVTSGVRVDERVAQQLAGGLVLTTTSGVDHIDVAACERAGVQVARCPLARRDAVVGHTVASALFLLHRLGEQVGAAAQGRWARAELPDLAPVGLAGAVVAVVGLGVIGERVSSVFAGMGAVVRGVDPYVDPTSATWHLHDALVGADLLTLHCALTPTSRGLIGAGELDLLSPRAVVVNTARGDSLAVEEAVRRVQTGRLGGLAVDVFPREPWPEMRVTAHPRLLLTPHSAGYTVGLGERVSAEVASALDCWLVGLPLPHPVRSSPAR
jgi:phosphoglycerate dehydrogenase-like enzyme